MSSAGYRAYGRTDAGHDPWNAADKLASNDLEICINRIPILQPMDQVMQLDRSTVVLTVRCQPVDVRKTLSCAGRSMLNELSIYVLNQLSFQPCLVVVGLPTA